MKKFTVTAWEEISGTFVVEAESKQAAEKEVMEQIAQHGIDSEMTYDSLGAFDTAHRDFRCMEVEETQKIYPPIKNADCTFGGCDSESVCQKLGQCRFKHHENP